MVELLIGRHGYSEPPHTVLRDEDRVLTYAGREQVRAVARGIQGAGLAPNIIISSPLVRAVQTAEIMSSVWTNGEVRIFVCLEHALAPGGDHAALIATLLRINQPRMALIGHEPDTLVRAERFVGKEAERMCARARGNGFLPGMIVGMTVDLARAATDFRGPVGTANFVVNPLGGHVTHSTDP